MDTTTLPMVDIADWCVVQEDIDPYCPPESRYTMLRGVVYGHPRKPDGMVVVTSPIINVAGRIVTTKHTCYRLLKPSEEYISWCLKNGYPDPTDSDQPIRVVH
jgi:hypothetical protein